MKGPNQLIIILKNCNYPSWKKEKRLEKELERAIWGLMIRESKPEEIVKLLDKVGIKKNISQLLLEKSRIR